MACVFITAVPGTREESGTLTLGGALSSLVPLIWRTQNSGLLVQALPSSHSELLFITAVPNTKLCAWGEEDSGGYVL